MHQPLEYNNRPLTIKKCIVYPDFTSQTVLTDSAWNYIESYLKQSRESRYKTALYYWQQAKNFDEASGLLDENSKPLTNYYCFLNAVKCLLVSKGVPESHLNLHGVSGVHNIGYTSLNNEIVVFLAKGVLFELEKYLGENTTKQRYKLRDLLYNIPCIHRAYSITNELSSPRELFIPICNARFVKKSENYESWFDFELEEKYQIARTLNELGPQFERDPTITNRWVVRNTRRFRWDTNKTEQKRLESLRRYHRTLRSRIFYIYGHQRLWYVKKELQRPEVIDHSNVVLTYSAMHKLSEICRYQPKIFAKHLISKHGWLLIEFINKSNSQFIDEIASEICGNELMPTGFRS